MSDCPVQCPRQDGRACGKCSADIVSELRLRGVDPSRRGVGASVRAAPYVSVDPMNDQIACSTCSTTRTGTRTSAGNLRTPKGWKSVTGGLLCPACLSARYLHRSLTIPIAGPVDGSWAELGAALRAQWAMTTAASNWLARELYVRDVRRQPSDTRLGPMPTWYCYPEMRAQFPSVSPINLTSLIQMVTATYRRHRIALLWQGGRQLATYRYPVPIPINEQVWQIEHTDGGAWIVSIRLGDAWWRLRLRGGREFAIHLQRLTQLHAGTALRGAASLRRHVAHTGDARTGPSADVRVLVTIAGWFPRVAINATGTTWHVSTGPSALLTARTHGQGEVWCGLGDRVRQTIAAHAVQDRRDAATLAVVRRWVPVERRAIGEQRKTRAGRSARAVRTQLQQLCAALTGAAHRAGVTTIQYDDQDDTFGPLPWYRLRQLLQSACETRGIAWVYAMEDRSASGPVDAPCPEALAETRT